MEPFDLSAKRSTFARAFLISVTNHIILLSASVIVSVASGGLGSRQLMAKALISLSLLIFLCFRSGMSSGELVKIVNAQKTWCVAKPSSEQVALMANIDYACSQVDCRILRKGFPCSYPDNLINHASIAMNLYYSANGQNWWNCDFRKSGLIVMTDPSYGDCKYE